MWTSQNDIGPILDDRLKEKFEFFIFTLFIGIFRFFPYITLAFFVFKLPAIVFHVGIWYLCWENLVPYEIENFWHFLKIPFFTVKGVIFLDFFPYTSITLVIFWFQATGHRFSPRNVMFGLREPCTIIDWRLLTFFENSIFTAKWVIFSDLLVLWKWTGGYWYNHGILSI